MRTQASRWVTWVTAVVAIALVVGIFARDSFVRSEAERSQQFWSALHVEGLREHYPTLEALVDDVDGVIVGRILSIGEGSEDRDLEAEAAGIDRGLSSVFYVRLTIRVESVLAGNLPGPGSTVVVEQLGDRSLVPAFQGKLPNERTLFFLTDKVVYDAGLQGVYEPIRTMRELDGNVMPVDPDERFLQDLSGIDFADATRLIAQAVSR